MAIQIQGNSGVVAEVSGTTFRGLVVHVKPLEYGALGHYRTTHRALHANTEAANARVFEMRNSASNFLILTRLLARQYQTAAGTAQMGGLEAFRCTSFTAVDTTNTVTPALSPKRASMAAAPGGAQVRGVTVAGAAAGMTGGTLTKDGSPFWAATYAVAAAAGTSNAAEWGPYDLVDDVNGTCPFVFAQNEGFELENRTLNTTTFGVEITMDLSVAEVTAF